MEEQMDERDPADGDAQILHVREIRLSSLAGPVPLLEDDVLLRPMQCFPLRDVSLQGAHLDGLVAPGMSLTQQRKQGGPLQGRVSFQLRHDPRPAFAAATCWVAPLCLACIYSLTSVSFFT